MEELAEMLREAQAGGGPAAPRRWRGRLPRLRRPRPGWPAPMPGSGSNVIPAAFGRRNKKKK